MNGRWKRPALAALALGLLLTNSGTLQAQYPDGGGHDPTPIAQTQAPGQPVCIPPVQLPKEAAPDLSILPHTMYGAFDDGQNCCSAPDTFHYFTFDTLVLFQSFDRNPAFNVNRPGVGSRDLEFERDPQVVPRITLNIQAHELWGVRGSWWRFFPNQSKPVSTTNADPNTRVSTAEPLTNISIVSPANAGVVGSPDVLSATSQLRMEVADLQATRYIEVLDWYGTLGLGIQYAYLSQNFSASRINDPAVGGSEAIFFGHNFSGAGPELSFDLYFPLGDWLGLYTKAGGTLFLGKRSQSGFFADTTGQGQVTTDQFTVIPKGELELGFSLRPGNNVVMPIFRVGFISQYWVNAGNATNPNANLILYGVNATVGFAF